MKCHLNDVPATLDIHPWAINLIRSKIGIKVIKMRTLFTEKVRMDGEDEKINMKIAHREKLEKK